MRTSTGLGALLVTLALAAGCDRQEQPSAPAPSAPVALPLPANVIAVAETRRIQPQFSLPGVIEALQEAAVHPEVPGRVTATHFAAGDLVQQGDLLVELDPSEYQANLDAAEAELMSAEANAKQALTNFERAEELQPKGFLSQKDYDQAMASLNITKAAVAKARAGRAKARLDLEHTRIHAPFGGRISKPRQAVGNYVQPTGQPLFELVQLDPIYAAASVEVGLYNAFVLRREELVSQGVTIPELEITLLLAGGNAYPHAGKFENWSHQSDETSGMIKGRALFPNPDGLLLPGQNVTLRGRTIQSYERVMIPQRAVLQDQQGRYIMVLDEDDRVQRRNVDLGARDGADWAVLEGVEAGTRVIREGGQTLRAGTLVSVQTGE